MVRKGGLEPPCLLGATPSRWCVCQFHHFRFRINNLEPQQRSAKSRYYLSCYQVLSIAGRLMYAFLYPPFASKSSHTQRGRARSEGPRGPLSTAPLQDGPSIEAVCFIWLRLTVDVRASLLVDPAELHKWESARTDTAMKAGRIAAQMSAYIGGAVHMIRKGQVRWVPGDDLLRQIQFIDSLFDLAA